MIEDEGQLPETHQSTGRLNGLSSDGLAQKIPKAAQRNVAAVTGRDRHPRLTQNRGLFLAR
jgi:hypothetical protein